MGQKIVLWTNTTVFWNNPYNVKNYADQGECYHPSWIITAVIILAWTPKICLECLLCCNQSQVRSSHYRNHRKRTVSNRSWNKLFSLFKDTNCLIRNLKHRCSPRSLLRTASSTSFDFRKKKVLEANATRRWPALHVTTYHMKTIKNEQSWCFRFW